MSVFWAMDFVFKTKILSTRQNEVVWRRICTVTTVTKTNQTLFEHNVLYVQVNGGLLLIGKAVYLTL
jgi:hypothetical protein